MGLFLFAHTSRPVVGTNQSSMQWGTWNKVAREWSRPLTSI